MPRTRRPVARRPVARRPRPQKWRTAMLASAVAVVAVSLVAAIAASALSGGKTTGPARGGGSAAAAKPGAARRQPPSVCLSNQACSGGLPYAQPGFLDVAMPRLEADLHKTEAQIVGAMSNGTSPTQLAARAGLSATQWYQDEASAFAAGFHALIAKNRLTVPALASHPGITTPGAYLNYMVNSIKTQGADFELALALGVNPMQAGIMPGGN